MPWRLSWVFPGTWCQSGGAGSWTGGSGSDRRAAAGPAAADQRRSDRAGHHGDAGAGPGGRGHALVDPVDGQITGHVPSAVSRIWRAFGLKSHIVETWKLSTDPQFIDKVRDVVGLY